MPTLHPTTNLDLNYTNGQSWDYNQEMQIIGDLLVRVVDFVQSSQPSTPSNGTAWANISNGTYNVFVNSTWRSYSGDGLILVGRGSLARNLYTKNGNNWNFVVNNANLVSPTLTTPTLSSPTITTPAVTGGTFSAPAVTGGTITNTAITTNQNGTFPYVKQNALPFWRSYNNYGGTVAMSANESWLKSAHSSSTDKLSVTYTANGVNPYLVCAVAGRYTATGVAVVSNNSGSLLVTLQNSLLCNSALMGMSYINIPINSFSTVIVSSASFNVPANATIEFKLGTGSNLGSMLSYDSFF